MLRTSSHLVEKHANELGLFGELGQHRFHGDEPIVLRILRPFARDPDRRHAAAPDTHQELAVAQLGPLLELLGHGGGRTLPLFCLIPHPLAKQPPRPAPGTPLPAPGSEPGRSPASAALRPVPNLLPGRKLTSQGRLSGTRVRGASARSVRDGSPGEPLGGPKTDDGSRKRDEVIMQPLREQLGTGEKRRK